MNVKTMKEYQNLTFFGFYFICFFPLVLLFFVSPLLLLSQYNKNLAASHSLKCTHTIMSLPFLSKTVILASSLS